MRKVPTVLKDKLLNKVKATDLNTMPDIRLIATQTTLNTLLSEVIHEDEREAKGDVCFRQMEGEGEITIAYAICIDEGMAKVYKRDAPKNFMNKWELLFDYRRASDVAIEYNGEWKMDAGNEWYYLRTEEYPYIFSIENNDLYVQKWRDENTRFLLASYVANVTVCKGWQSSVDRKLDQGLVVAYTRSGKVFYRTLACQEDGNIIWENEREVTEAGSGNTSLSLIRTNDFRVGFLTENNGEIQLSLTHRNYAGMSVRPETMHINTTKAKILYEDINRIMTKNNESMKVNGLLGYMIYEPVEGNEKIEIVEINKLNRTSEFKCYGCEVFLSKNIEGNVGEGFAGGCKTSDKSCIVSDSSVDGNKLIIYFKDDIRRTKEVEINTPDYRNLFYYSNDMKYFLPSLQILIKSETIDYYTQNNERIEISQVEGVMLYQDINKIVIDGDREHTEIKCASATVILEPVSTLPI